MADNKNTGVQAVIYRLKEGLFKQPLHTVYKGKSIAVGGEVKIVKTPPNKSEIIPQATPKQILELIKSKTLPAEWFEEVPKPLKTKKKDELTVKKSNPKADK